MRTPEIVLKSWEVTEAGCTKELPGVLVKNIEDRGICGTSNTEFCLDLEVLLALSKLSILATGKVYCPRVAVTSKKPDYCYLAILV